MMLKKSARSRGKHRELSALIDEHSEIEGHCTFGGAAVVNGKCFGEISSSDTLVIGETGVVNAAIRAGVVVISGEVVGNVQATTRVELRGHARMFGDVEAPILIIDEGVLFEGQCRMTQPREADFTPIGRDRSLISGNR